MKWVVIVLMIFSSSPQAVAVQAPDMDDVPFVKMLVVIMMYDYFARSQAEGRLQWEAINRLRLGTIIGFPRMVALCAEVVPEAVQRREIFL